MLEHLATAKGTAIIAGIAGGSILLGDTASSISGQTNISIGEAVAVMSVVLVGAWWLSSRLQKIDDRLERMEAAASEHKDNSNDITKHGVRLERVEKQIGIANDLAKI